MISIESLCPPCQWYGIGVTARFGQEFYSWQPYLTNFLLLLVLVQLIRRS